MKSESRMMLKGISSVGFAIAWLLGSMQSSAIPVVNLQDDGTFSANSYAMSRSEWENNL